MAFALKPAASRYGIAQNSDINVTPFVDIMLVLVIVFMVALPVATVSLKLDMPPAPPVSAGPTPTYISITADGALSLAVAGVDIRPTSLADLPNDLAAALGPRGRDHQIFVRAEGRVKYGHFMQVMNVLARAGYVHTGLITENVTRN